MLESIYPFHFLSPIKLINTDLLTLPVLMLFVEGTLLSVIFVFKLHKLLRLIFHPVIVALENLFSVENQEIFLVLLLLQPVSNILKILHMSTLILL